MKDKILHLAITFASIFYFSLVFAADDAVSVSGPTDLYANQSYDVTVTYSADAERQISVYLFNTSNWSMHGSASTIVSSGSGSVTLNVNVGNAPEGTSYQWTGKVEQTDGTSLAQVSQWCQVLFSPNNGNVSISADFTSTTGNVVNKRALGINVFKGFEPNIAGTPGNSTYKNNMNAMQPVHVRYHSWEMVDPNANGTWVDANGDWDETRIYNAMQGAYEYNPEVLINIPWPPSAKGWLNADNTLKTAHYDDFANWCAELVDIVNNQHGRGVKYWELTNERDDVYYNNCSELGIIFNQASDACKAVDPSILTGGPAFAKPFAEHIQNVRDFMQASKNHVDFISYHSYHLSGSFTNQDVFDSGNWGWVTNNIRAEWQNISTRNIEFHHNEYNLSAEYKFVEARTNATSMVFDALMVVSLMNAGVDVANAWNETDGWFGKMDGDFNRRPSSYMFELLNKYLLEGDIISSTSSDDKKVVQLVSRFNNTIQVLSINRSEAAQTIDFDFSGISDIDNATEVEISEAIETGGITTNTTTYGEVTTGSGYVSDPFAVTLFTFNTDGTVVTPPSEANGKVIFEYWDGVGGTSVNDIPLNTNPTDSIELKSIETPINWKDNFGGRVKGYIVPSTSGTYTFYIAADDNCQLWLSTDASKANMVNIAGHSDWTSSRLWTKYSSQKSEPIVLQANQFYYFEAIYKEGAGGDNCAVGWTGPGISEIAVIGTNNISSTYTAPPAYTDNAIAVSGNSSVEPGATYSISVDYEASTNRKISVYLFNTTSWQTYGSASTNVAPGNGTVTLNVDVTDPAVGTDYQWTAKVEDQSSGNALDEVSQWCQVVPEIFIDDAISVSGTSNVEAGTTYSIAVDYEASTDRQVSVYLFNTTSWQTYGSASTNVPTGNGTITLNVDVTNPEVGTDYQWTAKVEDSSNGDAFDQVSQWCQVIESAPPPSGDIYYIYSESGSDFQDEGGNVGSYAINQSTITSSAPEGSEFCRISPNNHYASYRFEFPGGADKSSWSGSTLMFDASTTGGFDIYLKDASGASIQKSLSNYLSNSGDWETATIPIDDFNGVDLSTLTEISFYRLWNADITLDFDNLRIVASGVKSSQVLAGVQNNGATGDIFVYPNPVNNVLHVKCGNLEQVLTIQLLDIAGQLVKEMSPIQSEGVQKIDLKNEKSGIYLLKIESLNQTQLIKIVKQ